MVELDAGLIDKAQKSIEKSLERVGKKQFKDEEAKVKEFVAESMGRISGSTDLPAVVKDTDIVIEAIVENLAVKQKLFASIDEVRMAIIHNKIIYFIAKILYRSPNHRQFSPATLRQFQLVKLPRAQSASIASVAFIFSIQCLL